MPRDSVAEDPTGGDGQTTVVFGREAVVSGTD